MTSGIIEILTDDTTVKNLVGKNKVDSKWKVYPTVCPQPEDNPYIVVSKTSNDTLSIGKDCLSLLDHPRYDIICYAKNFRRTEEMAEAVRNALDGVASNTDVCQFLRIWMVAEREAWSNDLELH